MTERRHSTMPSSSLTVLNTWAGHFFIGWVNTYGTIFLAGWTSIKCQWNNHKHIFMLRISSNHIQSWYVIGDRGSYFNCFTHTNPAILFSRAGSADPQPVAARKSTTGGIDCCRDGPPPVAKVWKWRGGTLRYSNITSGHAHEMVMMVLHPRIVGS